MRLKLTLFIDGRQNILPINYQYELSSWIYKTIHCGNSDFATWLHQHGYQLENKKFKLFTFSNFFISPPWKIFGDRIKILSDTASVYLSFWIPEAIEHFIVGLFQQRHFSIGDRKSKVQFEIQSVEKVPSPSFSSEMNLQCLSPICISQTIPDKKTARYLAPDDKHYGNLFFDNLLYKYLAVMSPERKFSELKEQMNDECKMSFNVIGKPKSRLVKIKANTPQQTFVRGYLYHFEITAPKQLIRFGFNAGFGEKNTMGFGCVEKF